MSKQIPQAEKAKLKNIKPDTQKSPSPRKFRAVAMLSGISPIYLLLLALAAIFLWQWLDGHRAISDMQQQLDHKVAQMGGGSKVNQILQAQSQDQIYKLSAQVLVLETRYAEAQNQRAALKALYDDLSVNRDEIALAEIEQVLLLAEQQLQLSANVKAALIAMQGADERLQRMRRPALTVLRQTLNRDMDKLRALPNVDIAGINLQLNNLLAAVDKLPMAYQRHAESEKMEQENLPEGESNSQSLLHKVWQEVKQLVRIEDTGKDEIPLLMPNQEFFLRENLKLRLLSVRIALLSRDRKSFSQELKTAQLWVGRYFDGKSSESVQMLAGLKKLAASDISIVLPDISQSVKAVRTYRAMRKKAAR